MDYITPTTQKPDDEQNLIFNHFLSLWLFCRRNGFPFRPKKVNFYQWTNEEGNRQ